jgi:hypothetical protein
MSSLKEMLYKTPTQIGYLSADVIVRSTIAASRILSGVAGGASDRFPHAKGAALLGITGTILFLRLYGWRMLKLQRVEDARLDALHIVSRKGLILVDKKTGIADYDSRRPTNFMKFIISEIQAEYGVPTYTQANILVYRRLIYRSVRSFRPDIRGKHLVDITDRILNAIFVPTKKQVAQSQVMSYNRLYQLVSYVRYALNVWRGEDTDTSTLHDRMAEYTRPSN